MFEENRTGFLVPSYLRFLEIAMKKQITLTALGLLTLAGGSWLAAQQREPGLATRSDTVARDENSSESEVTEARAGEEPAKARRPSATSPLRSTRNRPAQDVRGQFESYQVYQDEAARFADEARSIGEIRVTGPGQFAFGMPARMTPEDAARMRAFQDAIRELREAEDGEDKTAAREQVTKLVSEQLDADLENREKELAAIEQRAKELRKQLEERKTAKPELLKMLVMLIDNPQVGLGIPPEWMQMLMRGQPDRYRQGFPMNFGEAGFPSTTPIPPAMPPVDPLLRQDTIDDSAAASGPLERRVKPASSR